jgi:heme exporter protein A
MNKQLRVIDLHCVRQQRLLFAPVSFELHAGEALFIEGENGSGKSSLLHLLSGLSTPPTGEIRWQDQLIHTIRDQYARAIHFIGHTNGIKLGLSVNENLQLASQLALHEFKDNLEEWQLTSQQHSLASQLSAGQKRRIALAKLTLIQKPVWILDEPLTALDTHIQKIFLSALEKHLQAGGIAVISSHHPLQINAAVNYLRLTPC